MARTEIDKLLAAMGTHGGTGNGRTGIARLVSEVLKLSRTPRVTPTAITLPAQLVKPKTMLPEVTIAAARLLRAAPVAPATGSAVLQGSSDLGRLAAQVDQLRRSMTPVSTPIAIKTRASSSGSSTGGSGTNGIVKVISQFLGGSGLGSIVSGIVSLLGGGTADTPVPLYQFELPPSVSVEAGVTRRGQFVPVNYSQSGQARPNETPQPLAQPTRQGSLQAMAVDTRWFMDHSEDIASAVKEAMLHSHSINDVVADL